MENSSNTSSAEPAGSSLPYTDVKPAGAADFYTAVNATFRFMERRLGPEGLQRYWLDLGRGYYAPVAARWRAGGLREVAAYWRAFFATEPGARVEVSEMEQEVVVEVQTCPAIRHLREHGREIHPSFCQHCYYVSTAIGEQAAVEVRIQGGNGTCRQTFAPSGSFTESQKLSEIATC